MNVITLRTVEKSFAFDKDDVLVSQQGVRIVSVDRPGDGASNESVFGYGLLPSLA